jgi:N-acetyl-1-D-myo-inositol-2-amino-2-deoxy-alpha-D-glucopyranoside deacetylase
VTGHRLLLVHAHPDDETITTGATIARYAAEGVTVTLLTCTLGELGEILVPEYAGLAADRADQLGGFRIGELSAAARALGVSDHRFLGGAGRWRDSGMIDTDANKDPRAFWRCDSDEAAFRDAVEQAVDVIRETRPQVLITYDPRGGYGHPDHVMAHRVATAAVDEAARAGHWTVEKVYWVVTPESVLRRGVEAAAGSAFTAPGDGSELGYGWPDGEVSTAIDAESWIGAKVEALRAHATQVVVDEPFFALSNLIGQPISGTEYFRLVRGEPAGDRDADGRETDLFAGVSR